MEGERCSICGALFDIREGRRWKAHRVKFRCKGKDQITYLYERNPRYVDPCPFCNGRHRYTIEREVYVNKYTGNDWNE